MADKLLDAANGLRDVFKKWSFAEGVLEPRSPATRAAYWEVANAMLPVGNAADEAHAGLGGLNPYIEGDRGAAASILASLICDLSAMGFAGGLEPADAHPVKVPSELLARLDQAIKLLEPVGRPEPATPSDEPPAKQNKRQEHAKWLAEAMLTVQEHPDWSDRAIANAVGKSPSQLARSKNYKAAAKLAREPKVATPSGFVTIDPGTKLRDVEAVAPEDFKPQDRTDRGAAIPGSKYFREYCSECGEPMKVPKSQVGHRPTCGGCSE